MDSKLQKEVDAARKLGFEEGKAFRQACNPLRTGPSKRQMRHVKEAQEQLQRIRREG